MEFKSVRVKTQKLEIYDEKDGVKKDKYINLGYEPAGDINFEKLGFHFTQQMNFASIQATGLRPLIGSNSSGGLGKEAIDKTFFSYRIDGAMQLFNRLVSVSCEIPVGFIREAKDKVKYLLDYQKENDVIDAKKQLTMIEGFEYVRRYMQDCGYFAFEAVEPQYSGNIDEELVENQIRHINENLDNLAGIHVTNSLNMSERMYLISQAQKKILQLKNNREEENDSKKREKYGSKIQLYEGAQNFLKLEEEGISFEVNNPYTTIQYLDRLIDLLDKKDNHEKVLCEKLSQMRSEITIGIREKSKGQVDIIRGRIIEGTEQGANFERIDYNEDMVAWVDIDRYPHNAHTMIQETENGPKGVVINGSILQMLSLDGKKPATSLELTRHIFEQTSVEDRSKFVMNMPNRKVDSLIIEDLYEYVDMYYENRNNPTLLKCKLSDFQDRLIQKYASSKFFSKEKMSGTRMDLFIREATKEKDFESR